MAKPNPDPKIGPQLYLGPINIKFLHGGFPKKSVKFSESKTDDSGSVNRVFGALAHFSVM